MEVKKHSSIYVAPLHIVKSPSDLISPASDTSPLPIQTTHIRPKNQITPPQTPQTASQTTIHEAHESSRSSFRTFLRAFCPFQPPASVSPSTVTLPLNAGNIILVHSIHVNGWADGTLLDTGARGWLPTNYCEGYEHIPMRPLLKALTDFSDVMRGGHDASRNIFCNQDHMRGLIAGVRFLLEKSDCLTRDSSIVRNHDGIRRARKALLSDLSSLVKIAKTLQDCVPAVSSGRSVDQISSEMMLKAFKVVTRGVKFLDVWNEDVGLNCAIESVSAILGRAKTHERQNPLTPPAELKEENDSTEEPITTARPSARLSDHSLKSSYRQTIGYDTSFSRFDVQQPAIRERPVSVRSHRTSLSHRMTSGGYATGPTNPNLASERLRASHDVFLGCLGTFLGLHMQSRSSAELLVTTQHSVKSCRELLTVIEVVLEHDHHRSESLMDAKDAMYDNITSSYMRPAKFSIPPTLQMKIWFSCLTRAKDWSALQEIVCAALGSV